MVCSCGKLNYTLESCFINWFRVRLMIGGYVPIDSVAPLYDDGDKIHLLCFDRFLGFCQVVTHGRFILTWETFENTHIHRRRTSSKEQKAFFGMQKSGSRRRLILFKSFGDVC